MVPSAIDITRLAAKQLALTDRSATTGGGRSATANGPKETQIQTDTPGNNDGTKSLRVYQNGLSVKRSEVREAYGVAGSANASALLDDRGGMVLKVERLPTSAIPKTFGRLQRKLAEAFGDSPGPTQHYYVVRHDPQTMSVHSATSPAFCFFCAGR